MLGIFLATVFVGLFVIVFGRPKLAQRKAYSQGWLHASWFVAHNANQQDMGGYFKPNYKKVILRESYELGFAKSVQTNRAVKEIKELVTK